MRRRQFNSTSLPRQTPLHQQLGFSMAELMVALLLGLLTVGAAVGLLIVNRKIYEQGKDLAVIQNATRTSFEALGHAIRESSGNACDSRQTPRNMVSGEPWWSMPHVLGYENGALSASLAGTDAIEVVWTDGGSTGSVSAFSNSTGTSASITMSSSTPGVGTGDVAMICDFVCSNIFRVSSASGASLSVGTGANSTRAFACPQSVINPINHPYEPGALISRMRASRWFIAEDDQGQRGLYQQETTAGALGTAIKVADGITDLQMRYLEGNSYLPANAVTDWPHIRAVEITATFETEPKLNSPSIERQLQYVVQLRNMR